MLWICFVLLAFALLAAFALGESGTIAGFNGETIAGIAVSFALLMYIGGAVLTYYRGRLTGVVRDLAIWLGLLLIAVVGYSFRDEANFFVARVAKELLPPGQAVNAEMDGQGRQTVLIRKRWDGHFMASGRVNGAEVSMLIDTGASAVMLTSTDARAAGIDPSVLSYDIVIQTANGSAYAASVRLDSIEIGAIAMRDVDALVAKPGSLRESLLGMSFLQRLRSFEFSQDFITLRN